jgi:hypothetical protein
VPCTSPQTCSAQDGSGSPPRGCTARENLDMMPRGLDGVSVCPGNRIDEVDAVVDGSMLVTV